MLPEAWSVMFSGCEAKGEMRAGLSRASDLLRMLAIVKEVGVDLVVGEGLSSLGTVFCSVLSLCSC